ncbi:MAG: PDZ domain-containing protein [Erysipelotrichaceae bacterium]|nr:PDZ domain-containing protein [Erysipelotrichaceae bacterium]
MENDNEEKVLIDLKKMPLASERREIAERRKKRFLLVLACLFFFLLGCLITRIFFPAQSVIHNNVTVNQGSGVGEIEQIMERYWLYGDRYEDLHQELEDKAQYGMTAFDFDPYTSYMSQEEMDSFSDSINRSYVGIGVEYSYVNDAALIMRVFKSSPAEAAGLKAGDVIVSVEGTSVAGLSSDQIKELVLGEEGTIVTLGIETDGVVRDVQVTRGVVNSTVFAYTQDDFIIMELDSFGETTAEEAARYLDEFSDYEKIIIDLRSDSGGYQTAVRDISGLFIGPNEVYLRQKGIDGVETADATPSSSKKYDNLKKIVVLTSEDTASAAEVLAIVLRERCDAILVGDTTYGKGVIQTNRILRNGGVLKLTTYYWYSPDGVSIDQVGIVPDEEVRMPDIYYEYYFDMEDDETYAYDSVSDATAVSQKALAYLGYDVSRSDGYFDEQTLNAIDAYKADHGLAGQGILDQETYISIISETRRQLADPEKDPQLLRAIEIMKED